MKNRFWIYILILAVLVLAIMFWCRPNQHPIIPEPTPAAVQPVSLPTDNAGAANKNDSNDSLHTASATLPATQVVSNQETIEPRELLLQRMVEADNFPINFYGQIIDQDGQPISGVYVAMSARHPLYVGGISNTNIGMETLTDSGGRFDWTGAEGNALTVESIQKAGYELSPKAARFFSPSSGSFENPVVFKMWKEGTKEPLVSGSHVFGIDSGKNYTLDLINGKKIEGEADGDLRVSITRPADAKPRVNFPWSFSIEVIGGGLLESDDEFMYFAPESGYEPKIQMQFDPNDSNWIGVVNKRFFIRSRNGQIYGRVQIEVDAIYNVHSAIQINYTINPNGSRNLQP